MVGAVIDTSSIPSVPWITRARSTPSSARVFATGITYCGAYTPITWRRAPAGLVSGPSRLKIVGMPSALRTGIACRAAGWWWIAKQKQIPARSMQRRWTARSASTFTPSAPSTSALPRPVRLRLPCLATLAPAAAATIAATVETLKSLAVPPVPAVSRSRSGGTPVSRRSTFARITVAAPASSATVGTRVASSASMPPISAWCASPDMIERNASSISARSRDRPEASARMNGVRSPGCAARANSGGPEAGCWPSAGAMDGSYGWMRGDP